ncbi:hypothetical protein VNI00_004496 [Paramarasmius palmivorus]|uniref:Xylanolytic transcriptional activator regulatory domain-containing protein n=1 Tax=Paramarasmius palmivorus TaxID=297713 RepID=A0AAW0DIX9_9AGAR
MGVAPREKEREALPLGRRKPGRVLVLANTEELHERISKLCARVRELEDALKEALGPTHPLLREELLGLKMPQGVGGGGAGANRSASPPETTMGMTLMDMSCIDTTTTTSSSSNHITPNTPPTPPADPTPDTLLDSFGTLSISTNDETLFLGKTARSEFLIRALSDPLPQNEPDCPRISRRIVEATCTDSDKDPEKWGEELFGLLPPLGEALRLVEVYENEGGGLWDPIPREEVLDEVVGGIYRAPGFLCTSSSSVSASSFELGSSTSTTPEKPKNYIDHNLLSLLYAIFALASLFDPQLPPYNIQAQEYYYLARACMGLQAPFKRSTLRGVEGAAHLAVYLELSDWQALGTNSGLPVSGHALRLGMGVGLNLNSARWNLPLQIQHRRNRVFWQLFHLDTWMTFSYGRPPNMSPVYIDCPFPPDPDAKDGPSFHAWTYKYTLFIHTILQSCFSASPPSYTTILDADRKIRDFPVPGHLRPNCDAYHTRKGRGDWGKKETDGEMKRMLVLCFKENTLLNLHKPYFTTLLFSGGSPTTPTSTSSSSSSPSTSSSNPSPHTPSTSSPNTNGTNTATTPKDRFLPSLISTYRSAWRILRGLKHLHEVTPAKAKRWGLGWSWGLSACIVLTILITRAPTHKLSTSAMQELDVALKMYEESSRDGGRAAGNLLETVRTLHTKARLALTEPANAHPHPSAAAEAVLSCFPAPSPHGEDELELDRLGGKTRLVCVPVPPAVPPPSPPVNHTQEGVGVGVGGVHPAIAPDTSLSMEQFGFFDAPMECPTTAEGMCDIGGGGEYPSIGSYSGGLGVGGMGSLGVGVGVGGMGGVGGAVPMLDASWQSFVEQLGF